MEKFKENLGKRKKENEKRQTSAHIKISKKNSP